MLPQKYRAAANSAFKGLGPWGKYNPKRCEDLLVKCTLLQRPSTHSAAPLTSSRLASFAVRRVAGRPSGVWLQITLIDLRLRSNSRVASLLSLHKRALTSNRSLHGLEVQTFHVSTDLACT